MLGYYENFPRLIHRTTCFASPVSIKRLQEVLTDTLRKLNDQTLNFEAITDSLVSQYIVKLEFGVAETDSFNYLDSEEANRLLETIRKNPLQTLDFLCAVRYYRVQKEKKEPLRFDYYMLRFTFSENSVEISIFHERGPRHVSPEDIISLIAKKVNETSTKKILKEPSS
ncbi:hypothetical protein MUP01_08450 [Candidatus Bathyarchaeota archaeon]|nr:hypothetical protein [Candidatus Bathyarchaeota archaeon]